MHNVMGAHEALRYHYRKYWQKTTATAPAWLQNHFLHNLPSFNLPVLKSQYNNLRDQSLQTTCAKSRGTEGSDSSTPAEFGVGDANANCPTQGSQKYCSEFTKMSNLQKIFSWGGRAYFSVYYYTKCVLLKARCATLKRKLCNIKFLY